MHFWDLLCLELAVEKMQPRDPGTSPAAPQMPASPSPAPFLLGLQFRYLVSSKAHGPLMTFQQKITCLASRAFSTHWHLNCSQGGASASGLHLAQLKQQMCNLCRIHACRSFYIFLETWKVTETTCCTSKETALTPLQGFLSPPLLWPLPSRKAGLLLSAKSQSWKALGVGREHVPAGWLGEVLGIHSDLNNYYSYSCDSAPESGIFLCPQGWVLLTQCWRGHLVSPPGLPAPLPLPFVPRGHQREADREGEGEPLSRFCFISK